MRTNRPYVQIDPDVLERVRQIEKKAFDKLSSEVKKAMAA